MSRIDAVINDIKAAAFDVGTPELARRVGVTHDTINRLLRHRLPKSIKALRDLELEAAKIKADQQAPPSAAGAAETGLENV